MIVHLNGRLIPRDQAKISPFDRGFLFGDGVYEGLRAVADSAGSRVIGLDLHIERFRRGLRDACIDCGPFELSRLGAMSGELLKANGMRDAFVYWQITRGTPTESEPLRQRVPPAKGLRAGVTVFGYCAAQPSLGELARNGPIGKTCALIEDPRWSMGHLKSTSLIGNVVAAIEADRRGEQGGEEAILVRRGTVCEGLATNVLVVTRGGELVTPSLESAPMLAGITRAILINELGRELTQRRLTSGELAEAREIMLTGSSTMVASVVRLDGRLVGGGTPGPVAARLLGVLLDAIRTGRDASAPAEHIGGCAWGGFHPRSPERD